MKKIKLIVLLAFAAVLAFACSQAKPTENAANVAVNKTVSTANANSITPANTAAPDELASAKTVYSEKCVKCHKEDGKGGVTEFDGTKIKAPDLTSDRQKGKSDKDYVEIINNGASDEGMPAFKGKISDAEIANLVKYIRRDFQGKQ